MSRRKTWLFLFTALICLVTMFTPARSVSAVGDEHEEPVREYVRAKIIGLGEQIEEDHGYGMILYVQQVTLRVVSGQHEGLILTVEHANPDDPAYRLPIVQGSEMLVSAVFTDGAASEVYIEDVSRTGYLVWLAAGFFAVLVAAGGRKGLKAAVTLAVTILAIYKVLLPMLLAGRSPIPVSVLVAAAATTFTLVVVSGFRAKTLAAIIGTTAGVIIAGILAQQVGTLANLTGFNAEESRMLLYIPQEVSLDFRGLLFAGMLISALGAIMDVGMSIASAVDEVWRTNHNLSAQQLFASGMNVGRDVMGTMSNTLILAYTGGAIPMLLLFMAYQTPMARVANLDLVATEVVRALTGSTGLVLAIPITALAASLLVSKQS
jgi:uncharacterized membrane protein